MANNEAGFLYNTSDKKKKKCMPIAHLEVSVVQIPLDLHFKRHETAFSK